MPNIRNMPVPCGDGVQMEPKNGWLVLGGRRCAGAQLCSSTPQARRPEYEPARRPLSIPAISSRPGAPGHSCDPARLGPRAPPPTLPPAGPRAPPAPRRHPVFPSPLYLLVATRWVTAVTPCTGTRRYSGNGEKGGFVLVLGRWVQPFTRSGQL
jgi:hypothetical protein